MRRYAPDDLKFVIEDITGDDAAAGVQWHVEVGDGVFFPFSRGCSFVRLDAGGKIVSVRGSGGGIGGRASPACCCPPCPQHPPSHPQTPQSPPHPTLQPPNLHPPAQVRDVVEPASKPGDGTLKLLGTLTVRGRPRGAAGPGRGWLGAAGGGWSLPGAATTSSSRRV